MEIDSLTKNREAIKRAEYLMDIEDARQLTNREKKELETLTQAIDNFETNYMNLD